MRALTKDEVRTIAGGLKMHPMTTTLSEIHVHPPAPPPPPLRHLRHRRRPRLPRLAVVVVTAPDSGRQQLRLHR